MLSGILLIPFWWKHRPSFQVIRDHSKLVFLVAFFQTFTLYGLFYFGMTLVPGALAAMVIGASPLVSAVLAHYFMTGDRMSALKAASIGLGLIGVTILSISRQPWASLAGLTELAGIGILLLSNFSGALGNIIVARHRSDLSPVFLNSAQIFLGGLLLWTVSLPLEGPMTRHMPWPFWTSLLWLAFLSAAAFSIWFILLRRPSVRVSELNLWKFLIPVCGAVLSWILLPGEAPSFSTLSGMACIAAAIVLFNGPTLLALVSPDTKTH